MNVYNQLLKKFTAWAQSRDDIRAVILVGSGARSDHPADQWSDPKGEYLAEVAAGPVYKLLGKKDLGLADPNPPLDKPLITGDLGFFYHTGGHAVLPADWAAFFPFADAHLKPRVP